MNRKQLMGAVFVLGSLFVAWSSAKAGPVQTAGVFNVAGGGEIGYTTMIDDGFASAYIYGRFIVEPMSLGDVIFQVQDVYGPATRIEYMTNVSAVGDFATPGVITDRMREIAEHGTHVGGNHTQYDVTVENGEYGEIFVFDQAFHSETSGDFMIKLDEPSGSIYSALIPEHTVQLGEVADVDVYLNDFTGGGDPPNGVHDFDVTVVFRGYIPAEHYYRTPIPEPASLGLVAIGSLSLYVGRRLRRVL